MKVVDYLHERFFCLILTGHIFESHTGFGVRYIDFCTGFAKGHGVSHPTGELILHLFAHPAVGYFTDDEEEQNRQHPSQDKRKQGIRLGGYGGRKFYILVFHQLLQ